MAVEDVTYAVDKESLKKFRLAGIRTPHSSIPVAKNARFRARFCVVLPTKPPCYAGYDTGGALCTIEPEAIYPGKMKMIRSIHQFKKYEMIISIFIVKGLNPGVISKVG